MKNNVVNNNQNDIIDDIQSKELRFFEGISCNMGRSFKLRCNQTNDYTVYSIGRVNGVSGIEALVYPSVSSQAGKVVPLYETMVIAQHWANDPDSFEEVFTLNDMERLYDFLTTLEKSYLDYDDPSVLMDKDNKGETLMIMKDALSNIDLFRGKTNPEGSNIVSLMGYFFQEWMKYKKINKIVTMGPLYNKLSDFIRFLLVSKEAVERATYQYYIPLPEQSEQSKK